MKFDRRSLFQMIPAVLAVPPKPKEKTTEELLREKYEALRKEMDELKNKKVEVPEPLKFYGGVACSYSVYPYHLKDRK